MTFEMGTLISLIAAVIAGAVGYGRLLNKNENESRENASQWKVINDLRDWQSSHEKFAAEARLQLEREDSRMREMIAGKDGKIDEVLRRIDVIDKKIDKLETRDERT
jgi:hypothetical protein